MVAGIPAGSDKFCGRAVFNNFSEFCRIFCLHSPFKKIIKYCKKFGKNEEKSFNYSYSNGSFWNQKCSQCVHRFLLVAEIWNNCGVFKSIKKIKLFWFWYILGNFRLAFYGIDFAHSASVVWILSLEDAAEPFVHFAFLSFSWK